MRGHYTSTAIAAVAGIMLASPASAEWTFQYSDDEDGASATVGGATGGTVFSLGCSAEDPGVMDFVIGLVPSARTGPEEVTLTIAVGRDEFTLTSAPIVWDESFVPMVSNVPWEGELQDEIRASLRSGSSVTLSGEGLRTTIFDLRGSSAALRELESACAALWSTQAPAERDEPDREPPVAAGRGGNWETMETDQGGAITLTRQEDGTIFAVECGGSVLPDNMQIAMLVDGTETETTPVTLEYSIDDEPFTANANILPQGGGIVVVGTQYPYDDLVRRELFDLLRGASTVTMEGGPGYDGASFSVVGADAAMDELEAMCVSLGHIADPADDRSPDRAPEPVVAGRSGADWEFMADNESALAVTYADGGRALGLECVDGLVENHMQIAVIVQGTEDGSGGADTFTFSIDGEEYTANADFFPQEDGETVLMSTQYNYNGAFRDLILDGFREGSTFTLSPGDRYEGFSFDLSESRAAVNDVESACIRLGFLEAADDSGDADAPPPPERERDAPPTTRDDTGDWVLDVVEDSAIIMVEGDDRRAFGLNCVQNDPGIMRIFTYIRGGLLVPNSTELSFEFDGNGYTANADTVRDEGGIVGFIARYDYDDTFRENIFGDLTSAQEASVASPVAREDYTFEVAGAEGMLPQLDAACADLWGTEPTLAGAVAAPAPSTGDGTKQSESNVVP